MSQPLVTIPAGHGKAACPQDILPILGDGGQPPKDAHFQVLELRPMAMTDLFETLSARFGEPVEAPDRKDLEVPEAWRTLAARRSHRHFLDKPVAPALIETLAALALSAPSKSDLQQRDIVVIEEPGLRQSLNDLVADQPWVAGAPTLLVICANNRRQRLLHRWRGRPFANDHLDAFFNAAVDGGIALATLVLAAEAVGLGCCPISGLRN